MSKDKRIFISYCSIDANSVDRLCEALAKRGLHDFWRDQEMIRTGSYYREDIAYGIINCECFILCLSKSFEFSEVIKDEFEFAQAYNKKIFVFTIDGFAVEKSNPVLAFTISRIQHCRGDIDALIDDVFEYFNIPKATISSAPENTYFGGYAAAHNGMIYFFSSGKLQVLNPKNNRVAEFSSDTGSQLLFSDAHFFYCPDKLNFLRKPLFPNCAEEKAILTVSCVLRYESGDNKKIFFIDGEYTIRRADDDLGNVVESSFSKKALQIGFYYKDLIVREKEGKNRLVRCRNAIITTIAEGSNSNFCIFGGILYYIANDTLLGYDFEMSETTELKRNIKSEQILCGANKLYYIDDFFGAVYCVDLKDIIASPAKISAAGGCSKPQIAGNFLFYKRREKVLCFDGKAERTL